MNSFKNIHVRHEAGTAWITIDRPPLNILDMATMKELAQALNDLAAATEFIVFQGAGPKAFSAGAEVREHLPETVAGMLEAFHSVFRRLARSDCITIAAVHGHCLGGGLELAAFCDFVVATESAKFGQPEIKLGCFPPIAMVTLPHLCGLRAALDLILTGRTISAREAQALGIVSRVVGEAQLEESVTRLLGDLHATSPVVARITRQALRKTWQDEFEQELAAVERLYLNDLMKTEDAKEGIRAFLEKRSPEWRGL